MKISHTDKSGLEGHQILSVIYVLHILFYRKTPSGIKIPVEIIYSQGALFISRVEFA